MGGIDELAHKLGCRLIRGLCPETDQYSLDRRREVFGENKFLAPEMKSFWAMVFENLQDPTLILLMAAALVSPEIHQQDIRVKIYLNHIIEYKYFSRNRG